MTGGEYGELVEAARSDERVVGLLLTGSRGRGVFAQRSSDWDVRLIVRDDALAACDSEYRTPRGAPVEVVVLSVSGFSGAGAPGSKSAWDRYSYVHAQVVLDKLDGAIERLTGEKAVLPAEAADRLASAELDAYINSYYRSVKNRLAGLDLESHLDAAESVAQFLTALFAIYRRVRPYNKFLRWELETFPLEGARWSAAQLLPRIDAITSTGDPTQQQELFCSIEKLARERGIGAVIDGWEPDLPLLRDVTGRAAHGVWPSGDE